MIRPARREDARTLAELEVRAWRWAYVDFVPEEEMPTVTERLERWETRTLEGASVWDQDGLVVGVVQVRPGEDGDPRTATLRGLYVDPAAQGAGVGSRLHDHAIGAMQAAGCTTGRLWTFAANGHGRAFYAARGWEPDGGEGAWRGVPEVRYRRALGA
ncbi:MAG TPA: GNAT family N-acetyltransferase [Baekduia sp.]|nr:GNAT family N-acetyltransferase [Baekduia sp.]